MHHKEANKKEFERQLDTLTNFIDSGKLLLSRSQLFEYAELLKPALDKLPITTDTEAIPFVLIVKSIVLKPEHIMEHVIYKGQQGTVNMYPTSPDQFDTIPDVSIPDSPVYLITNIITGKDTLNITPYKALQYIKEQGRSPLTIEEGLSVLLHFPDILKSKNAFSLVASRQPGQKVPALWISYKRPRLGWCWDNNPHTWLGSASCENRI